MTASSTTKATSPPADLAHLPDPNNYVDKTITRMKYLPPVTWTNFLSNVNWGNTFFLVAPPLLAIYGFYTTPLLRYTAIFSVLYYFFTGLGITAGYHRLWSHRSYNASVPVQVLLALAGAGSVQGSIKWWCRGHRAHHRYTDTKLDPYSANEGFFSSHIGWIIFKPRGQIGASDISDLTRNWIVKYQHKYYGPVALFMAFGLPSLIAGLGWGDYLGGFLFAGCARLVFVHHSTFAVNSFAHMFGEHTYDNKHSPRDNFLTSLVTFGEGYHNFHHQFPMDFRNAIKWYQYDPTKWLISAFSSLGLASHLKRFPDNEIQKGKYTMQLEKLQADNDSIKWPKRDLPVVSWEDFQAEAKERSLVAIHGFIHDCSSFIEDHPGGANLIKKAIGTDATAAFFGGVYDHSNAAHNILGMMRVGILDGGMEVESLKLNKSDLQGYESDSGASAASDDSVLSGSDIDAIVEEYENKRPIHQPSAYVPIPYVLPLPASERIALVKAKPELLPAVLSRVSTPVLTRVSTPVQTPPRVSTPVI
ncbi:stearoyl-CoA 9-desaturase [Vanrija albida]|uniref:Stearoyl-CoA 9-desaturase n=1 Tax=Vanrija albida TaxID=181172 RepID=A0ABR3Q099_9TREE